MPRKIRPTKRRIAVAVALFSSSIAAAMILRVAGHQNAFSFLVLALGVGTFLMLVTNGRRCQTNDSGAKDPQETTQNTSQK